jgi:hypothetical protein
VVLLRIKSEADRLFGASDRTNNPFCPFLI